MNILFSVFLFSFVVLLLYAMGVFAMCRHAGENHTSSAIEASGWLAAFSLSHFIAYLALPLH